MVFAARDTVWIEDHIIQCWLEMLVSHEYKGPKVSFLDYATGKATHREFKKAMNTFRNDRNEMLTELALYKHKMNMMTTRELNVELFKLGVQQ